ncbi:MAG TPA: CsgG/HfaB family protein [Caulobacteraceae bacterium]|nr:CsgG/HfaB family protein [Caulobacteraceae bacterium]
MRAFLYGLAVAFAWIAPGHAVAQSGKPIIAIYQMEDVAQSGQAGPLSAMIETAIASTSKFRVIERERLGRLVGEQARAKSGLVTSNTPGKIGGFEGADFLIYGTITTVSLHSKADFGSNLASALLSSSNSPPPNCNNTFATLGLDIKITDARSGEIRYVAQINETQKAATQCGGRQGDIDTSALLRAAAEKVAAGLVTAIYPVQVAAVQEDGTLTLNYGEGTLKPDQIMTVFSKGKVIRDPATGEVLANEEVHLGYIKVASVTGRVSRALPMSVFAQPPPVGSIVRPATPAEVQALLKPKKRK